MPIPPRPGGVEIATMVSRRRWLSFSTDFLILRVFGFEELVLRIKPDYVENVAYPHAMSSPQ